MFHVCLEHPLIEVMLLSSIPNTLAASSVHPSFVWGPEPEVTSAELGFCVTGQGNVTGTGLEEPKRDSMSLFVWVGKLLSRCLCVASGADTEAAQL